MSMYAEKVDLATVAATLIQQFNLAAQGDPRLLALTEQMKLLTPEKLIEFLVQNNLLAIQDHEPTIVDHCFTPDDEASVLEKINALDPALINTKSSFDVTLLHEAACRGYMQATQRLLELGADRSAVNTLGETAAQRCRHLGYKEIADLIG
jgi:hypothetical protein